MANLKKVTDDMFEPKDILNMIWIAILGGLIGLTIAIIQIIDDAPLLIGW